MFLPWTQASHTATIRRMDHAAAPVWTARTRAGIDPGAAALGLQMAIAGMAAFFFAQLIRLEVPSWTIFTVMMVLGAQYVGAIQEKALLRTIGTLIGGSLAYFAVSGWQQSPVIFLTASFLLIAFSAAMFSQSRAPYAFYLTGLTYVVIAGSAMPQPQYAWAFALDRIEAVVLGVLVSLVVQSTIFPRYASRDFGRQVAGAMDELRKATEIGIARFTGGGSGLTDALRGFPARSSALRMLMRHGGRESEEFRRHIDTHAETIGLLARTANLLRSLGRVEPPPEPYRSALGELVAQAGSHLVEGWQQLQMQGRLPPSWRPRARELRRLVEEKIISLRKDPAAGTIAPALVGSTSVHLLTLEELARTLRELDNLGRRPNRISNQNTGRELAPVWPGVAGLRQGLRAGIACAFAFFLEDWLSPPGGGLTVLAVFMFTALPSLDHREGGSGGAFNYVVSFTFILAAAFLLLLSGTPLLASYAVLNIVLGTWLFLIGYWVYNRGGSTLPIQMSSLLLVTIVGLNPQEPVAFENIVGIIFGLLNGLVIAAVATRLLWPDLPQRRWQQGMAEYLQNVETALTYGLDHLPLWKRTRIALWPAQARKLIHTLHGPAGPSPDERSRLEHHVATLQDLTGEVSLCAGRLRPQLPPDHLDPLREPLDVVKETLRRGLEDFVAALLAARPPRDTISAITAVRDQWDACVGQLRNALHASGTPPREAVPLLALAARYRTCLILLEKANQQARSLHLADYIGDVTL